MSSRVTVPVVVARETVREEVFVVFVVVALRVVDRAVGFVVRVATLPAVVRDTTLPPVRDDVCALARSVTAG